MKRVDDQQPATPESERPESVREWIWHLDLHLTEHDERHAGLALRAAWPSVREWLETVEGYWRNVRAALPVSAAPKGRWPWAIFYNGYWFVKKSHAERAVVQSESEASVTRSAGTRIEPQGHDEAQELIASHVQQIQIIADAFGYDPFEWLADDGTPRSATAPIRGMPIIKALKDQRDGAADVLRRLMHKLREDSGSTDPMEPFAYDHSWELLAIEADAILAKCPSWTQQLRNIAEGLGMTYEELVAGIDRATNNTTDRKANP